MLSGKHEQTIPGTRVIPGLQGVIGGTRPGKTRSRGGLLHLPQKNSDQNRETCHANHHLIRKSFYHFEIRPALINQYVLTETQIETFIMS
jgi:hypothetical protein